VDLQGWGMCALHNWIRTDMALFSPPPPPPSKYRWHVVVSATNAYQSLKQAKSFRASKPPVPLRIGAVAAVKNLDSIMDLSVAAMERR
jgi:hypothetical protein